ncbi:hypothetical protein BP6252_06563 [Coleophoma cylindrospora]|uniref:Fungal N-terminal domain-containing protein n=1 Tax=Coleophoma cylindrospora TaxID=1849047 RepID=A0A3D8RNN5_9HELO|nr:hypothetical protein BP6252_06563 [Coleophoma cylindrospora]
MPEPLSIVVAAASLVATATKALQSINQYRLKYSSQDISAISMKAQCDCIQIALVQIQSALLNNQQMAARMISDDSFTGKRLMSVLGACELTFAVLVGRLSVFNGSLNDESGLLSRRAKLERLWNESNVVDLSQNISRLSEGLNLLLAAISMKSLFEIHQCINTSAASMILERVVDDASSIKFSDGQESLVSQTRIWMVNQDPMSHTAIDPKEFTFDQEVLNTKAYRRVQVTSGTVNRKVQPEWPVSVISSGLQKEMQGEICTETQPSLPTINNKPISNTSSDLLMAEEYSLTHDLEMKLDSEGSLDQSAVSYHSHDVGPAETTKKLTLKDFMPKAVTNPDNGSSESASTVINSSRNPYSLYITPKEVNISSRGLVRLDETAVEAVQETLQSLPQAITSCRSLTYLNLRENNLTEFPLQICSITSLKTLHLAHNAISVLPEELLDLSNLEFLNVVSNRLRYLPLYLKLMENLTAIYVHDNPFECHSLQQWQRCPRYYLRGSAEEAVSARELKEILDNQFSLISNVREITGTSEQKVVSEIDCKSHAYASATKLADMFGGPNDIGSLKPDGLHLFFRRAVYDLGDMEEHLYSQIESGETSIKRS